MNEKPKEMTLADAYDYVDSLFPSINNVYDSLALDEHAWEDDIKKFEYAMDLINDIEIAEHSLGISHLVSKANNIEQYISWLSVRNANILCNYGKEYSAYAEETIQERISVYTEELDNLYERIDTLRETCYVELDL